MHLPISEILAFCRKHFEKNGTTSLGQAASDGGLETSNTQYKTFLKTSQWIGNERTRQKEMTECIFMVIISQYFLVVLFINILAFKEQATAKILLSTSECL